MAGNDAASGIPRNRVGQISHSVVLGTFNVGDQDFVNAYDRRDEQVEIWDKWFNTFVNSVLFVSTSPAIQY